MSCSVEARRPCTRSGSCRSIRRARASRRRGCDSSCGTTTAPSTTRSSRCLPPFRARERLCERPAALSAAHFPDREEDERDARRRLAFEELFLVQLAVAGRRRSRREGRRARPLEARGTVVDGWRSSLPFELTGDQLRAICEIDADVAGERPMQRLLMGEVGTGKTAVALAAMLRAVENGAQAALMAPTETLAEQHHRTLDGLLGGSLPVELLTGSTKRGAPTRSARSAGRRSAAARGRHARADRGDGRFPRPCAGRRRRAAPLGCAGKPRSTPRRRRSSLRTRQPGCFRQDASRRTRST